MSTASNDRACKTRSLSRSTYILLFGVLGWGLPVGLAWPLAMCVMNGWEHLPVLLPLSLVTFGVGGYFFGAFMWRQAELERAPTGATPAAH